MKVEDLVAGVHFSVSDEGRNLMMRWLNDDSDVFLIAQGDNSVLAEAGIDENWLIKQIAIAFVWGADIEVISATESEYSQRVFVSIKVVDIHTDQRTRDFILSRFRLKDPASASLDIMGLGDWTKGEYHIDVKMIERYFKVLDRHHVRKSLLVEAVVF